MKYVWSYTVVCGFIVLIACVTYFWFPAYSYYLVEEDNFLENISALCFVSSFFFALLLLAKLHDHKRLLTLVLILGLVGFLEEISFGERIFMLSMPEIWGVKIDSLHDFFFLAYLHNGYTLPFAVIGFILFILIAGRWVTARTPNHGRYFGAQNVFLIFFAASVLSATIIDLEIIKSPFLFMLEEVLEMNAGLALIFCCLSLQTAAVE